MFSIALGLLLNLVRCISSSQVPFDGVIKGVRLTGQTSNVNFKETIVETQRIPGKLRVVENSGICETTPNVHQASGYGDISANESMWFWYFAARNNADSAPVTIWLNGGPGSSSMIGLFQEHGPCRIKNDSSDVTHNPYSWNEVSNMIYIDQPIGVGYSHGPTTVNTSIAAARDVWKFLQIFFSDPRFADLIENKFAIWTESYGGHYGPTFAAYFLQQNAAIASGQISGITLNLQVLGVGNGLTDPLNQYPGYLTYASTNRYHPLVSQDVIDAANISWTIPGGCRDQITNCYANPENTTICSDAQNFCNNEILGPLSGDWDVYYVPTLDPDPYPPNITSYLTSENITSKIGAEATWEESNDDVYYNFVNTGDWMTNSRLPLQDVINSGIRTIIYDGDADYILNYQGVEAMVDALQTNFTAEYHAQKFSNFTVAGEVTGIYKNAGTFSYIRIFGAGHEVPAYQYGSLAHGQAALQFFSQIMSDQPLSSTNEEHATPTNALKGTDGVRQGQSFLWLRLIRILTLGMF